MGNLRRLQNGELHSLYHSPDIFREFNSRILRWTSHVARMEESRSFFKILTGKPKENNPLGRLRCGSEDNVRINHNYKVSIRGIQLILLRIVAIGEPL